MIAERDRENVGTCGRSFFRLLLACGFAIGATALPIGDEAAEAVPPWIRCDNGRIRRTLLAIDVNFGEGLESTAENPRTHRNAINIAIYNWAGNTPIRFDETTNDLAMRRLSLGSTAPAAQHFPTSLIESSCSLVDSRIDFNGTYTNNYSTEKLAGVAVHEMGHRIGLAHDASLAECNRHDHA